MSISRIAAVWLRGAARFVGLARPSSCPAGLCWAGIALLLGTGGGVAFAAVSHYVEPFHPRDVSFYFSLFAAIGAFTGLLSRYLARLVALGHVTLAGVAGGLLLPYSFLLLLGAVVLGSVVFGMVFLACCVAASVAQPPSTRSARRTY